MIWSKRIGTDDMNWAGISRSTMRQGNEAVGMHYIRVSQRILCQGNYTVCIHYAWVSDTT